VIARATGQVGRVIRTGPPADDAGVSSGTRSAGPPPPQRVSGARLLRLVGNRALSARRTVHTWWRAMIAVVVEDLVRGSRGARSINDNR
jgi:hypothetical protein